MQVSALLATGAARLDDEFFVRPAASGGARSEGAARRRGVMAALRSLSGRLLRGGGAASQPPHSAAAAATPGWELTASDAQELCRLMSQAAPSSSTPRPPASSTTGPGAACDPRQLGSMVVLPFTSPAAGRSGGDAASPSPGGGAPRTLAVAAAVLGPSASVLVAHLAAQAAYTSLGARGKGGGGRADGPHPWSAGYSMTVDEFDFLADFDAAPVGHAAQPDGAGGGDGAAAPAPHAASGAGLNPLALLLGACVGPSGACRRCMRGLVPVGR